MKLRKLFLIPNFFSAWIGIDFYQTSFQPHLKYQLFCFNQLLWFITVVVFRCQIILSFRLALRVYYSKVRVPQWLSKESASTAGATEYAGSIPGLGRFPWRRAWQPTPYSCLENPMDRGAWWATDHGVAKSQTRVKQLSTHTAQKQSCTVSFSYSNGPSCSSGLETLHVVYQCLGLDSPAIEK